MTVDGKLPSLPVATREGYIFDGWYDSNGVKIATDYVFSNSVTITAKWIKDEKEESTDYVFGLIIVAATAALAAAVIVMARICSKKL